MAKFKVGNKVTDKNGIEWVIDKVIEDTREYLVHMADSPSDKGKLDEWMLASYAGSQKFKVGDKVLDEYGDPWTIVQRHPGKKSYILKPIGFSAPDEMKSESKLTRLNSAPFSTNPVVANALKAVNSGCTNEYKARAKAAIDDGYRLLCESVATLEYEANRLADIARSHGDKNEWNVILRKQSLLSDLAEKSWKDAQRLINS